MSSEEGQEGEAPARKQPDAVVPSPGRPTAVARRDPQATAAWAAARRTTLVSALLFGHMPFWLQDSFSDLIHAMVEAGISWGGALSVGNGLLLLAGGALVSGAAQLIAPTVRQAAARSPDEGRAAAAGACLAGAACGLGAVTALHAYMGFAYGDGLWWLAALRYGVVALGVGLLGAGLFREAEPPGRERELPDFYYGLRAAAGMAVATLFGLGALGTSPFGWGAFALVAASAAAGSSAVKARRLQRQIEALGAGETEALPPA